MPECRVKKCKEFAESNGVCAAHSKQYTKQLVGEEGSKKPEMVPTVTQVIKNSKDNYYGGGANEPHVHVYASGAHLKLGKHRYNLVQGGKRYEASIKDAYEALDTHAMGTTLRPWVDAALALLG
jgi:hypothetical protein